jgi:hypothetical protein
MPIELFVRERAEVAARRVSQRAIDWLDITRLAVNMNDTLAKLYASQRAVSQTFEGLVSDIANTSQGVSLLEVAEMMKSRIADYGQFQQQTDTSARQTFEALSRLCEALNAKNLKEKI